MAARSSRPRLGDLPYDLLFKIALGVYDSLSASVAPAAHAASHAAAGDDPVTIERSQVTGLDAALNDLQETDTELATTLAPRVRYETTYIDAGAMVPAVTSGAAAETAETATNDISYDRFLFDATTSEAVFFKLVMPENWDQGTVKVRILWDGAATASGDVVWGVSAVAASNDDPIDTALGTEVTVADTLIAVGDLHITAATAELTVGGTPALRDLIFFKVRRIPGDAGDTITVDTHLLGVEIQYHTNDSDPAAW